MMDMTGLCHITELQREPVEEPSKSGSIGTGDELQNPQNRRRRPGGRISLLDVDQTRLQSSRTETLTQSDSTLSNPQKAKTRE